MDCALGKISSSSLDAAVSVLSGGRLRVARFSGLRGLQAVSDIAFGDPLMSVPLELILLPDDQASQCTQPKRKVCSKSSASSELYQLSANLCRILTENPTDCSYLDAQHIRKCLLGEANADAKTSVEATIVAASEVVELRLRLRQALESVGGSLGYFGRLLIRELAAPAKRWRAQQLPPGADRQLWLACCYWVNTRAVHCPVLNMPALVPYFDLFNHSPSVSVLTDFEPASRRFTLTTLTQYAAGDQVYINYGNHSNLTLLAEYNFVLGPGANEHDSLPVDIAGMLSLAPGQLRQFLDQLHAQGMCPHPSDYLLSNSAALVKYFHLSMDGPSYYLLLLLFLTSEYAGGCDLSNVLQSVTEDQMTEQLGNRLAAVYNMVKAELLRDRNQILGIADSLVGDECAAIKCLMGNCVKLMDIWCEIVNAITDKN